MEALAKLHMTVTRAYKVCIIYDIVFKYVHSCLNFSCTTMFETLYLYNNNFILLMGMKLLSVQQETVCVSI